MLERSRSTPRALAVIDVGTAKICCLIAAPDADGLLALRGVGFNRSQGLKSGMIVVPEEAERALRAAVGQAERMAGASLDEVVVSAVCGRPRAQTFLARAPVEGAIVTGGDIDRVIAGGEAYAERGGRILVQLSHAGWRLDGAGGIADPRGLAGRDLAAELTAVTADEAPMRNLLAVVERAHLVAASVIVAPFASALATTSLEERSDRTLVVDIGAGVTSLAAFADGRMIFTDAIPVGGNHVTYDIARALATPVAEAERIKTLYGTLVKAASDAAEFITFPVAGEDETSLYQTSKARLRDIIEPRIGHLFGLVEERLTGAGLGGLVAGRVVLTGGASQLQGLDQVWAARFGGMVRIGRPRPIGRMPQSLVSPAFATVIGLALATAEQRAALGSVRRPAMSAAGYLGRMRQWISESF